LFYHYTKLDYPLYFWRSQNGVEVDIFLGTSKGYAVIELKNGTRWDKKFNWGCTDYQRKQAKIKLHVLAFLEVKNNS